MFGQGRPCVGLMEKGGNEWDEKGDEPGVKDPLGPLRSSLPRFQSSNGIICPPCRQITVNACETNKIPTEPKEYPQHIFSLELTILK